MTVRHLINGLKWTTLWGLVLSLAVFLIVPIFDIRIFLAIFGIATVIGLARLMRGTPATCSCGNQFIKVSGDQKCSRCGAT